MKIGIVGTGNIGSSVGRLWAKNGHSVMFGSRDPEKGKELAEAIGYDTDGGSVADAAEFGDVVLLAVPYDAAKASIAACGSLAGKIVIDCSNPMDKNMDLALGFSTSAAEEISKLAAGSKVVKGMNTVSAKVHESQDPYFQGVAPSVYFAGDDAEAKEIVAQLIADAGYEAVDAGPLRNARLIEPFGNLLLKMAAGGMGAFIASKLLVRDAALMAKADMAKKGLGGARK